MSLIEAPSLPLILCPDWGIVTSINLNYVWFFYGQTIMLLRMTSNIEKRCVGYVPDWGPVTSININYVTDWGPFTSINLNYVPDWGPFTSNIKSELCPCCPIIWIMSDWGSFTSIIKYELCPWLRSLHFN